MNNNGNTRIAVDNEKLKSYTVRDSYLLPTVQEIMDTQTKCGSRVWTACKPTIKFPIKSERDSDLTTFVVPGGGLYRYK